MVRSMLLSAIVVAFGAAAFAEEVTFGNLKSKTPASWKAGTASTLRMHSFTIPKAKGDDEDADVGVFFFGVGGGGGVEDNLKRWKGFFDAPPGKSIDTLAKVEKFKV